MDFKIFADAQVPKVDEYFQKPEPVALSCVPLELLFEQLIVVDRALGGQPQKDNPPLYRGNDGVLDREPLFLPL